MKATQTPRGEPLWTDVITPKGVPLSDLYFYSDPEGVDVEARLAGFLALADEIAEEVDSTYATRREAHCQPHQSAATWPYALYDQVGVAVRKRIKGLMATEIAVAFSMQYSLQKCIAVYLLARHEEGA